MKLLYTSTILAALIFLVIDIIWLSFAVKSFYRPNIGHLLLDKPVMLSPQRENFLRDNIYIKHYNSGYAVFKNHPWFGVGNKNYRIETRNNQFKKENYIPDTHPHQIYLELLSEHGIIGTMILLSIIFFLIFSNIKDCIISKNSLQLGAFCFLVINFLPVLPSGAFFSDLNITLFFINFSIYIACNPSSNIFRKKIKNN